MLRVLDKKQFLKWFHSFLPHLAKGKPGTLLKPAVVTDRTDGKLVHLDGLNLSRAWCMVRISRLLDSNDPARVVLEKAAVSHAVVALKNVTQDDHYSGGHWLASFSIYLLSQ